MATRDWLGLKEELPHRRKILLTVLSFLVPFALWCAVSYIPWLWHPNMRITVPGDVDYFTEDMDLPRADFQRELEKVRAAGGTLPEGIRVNPVYLAFATPGGAGTSPPPSPRSPACRTNPGCIKALGHSIPHYPGGILRLLPLRCAAGDSLRHVSDFFEVAGTLHRVLPLSPGTRVWRALRSDSRHR